MIRDDVYAALEACDREEESFECWPAPDIRVGMLIQATPGHKEFFKRANQTGIVAHYAKDRADVLWSDGSLEKDLRPYSLEIAHKNRDLTAHVVEKVLKTDWSYEEDTYMAGNAKLSAISTHFKVGDLVSPGYGFEHFHDYQGAGLVVEVVTQTIPAELVVLWPNGSVWMMEDDLVPYDD